MSTEQFDSLSGGYRSATIRGLDGKLVPNLLLIPGLDGQARRILDTYGQNPQQKQMLRERWQATLRCYVSTELGIQLFPTGNEDPDGLLLSLNRGGFNRQLAVDPSSRWRYYECLIGRYPFLVHSQWNPTTYSKRV